MSVKYKRITILKQLSWAIGIGLLLSVSAFCNDMRIVKLFPQERRAVVKFQGKEFLVKVGNQFSTLGKVKEITENSILFRNEKNGEVTILKKVNGDTQIHKLIRNKESAPSLYMPVSNDNRHELDGE